MNQSTPKSRRKIAAVTYGALAVVLLGIELMAVKGQLTFAERVLKLDGLWPYFVPVSLEGVTLAAAGLTMWAVMQRDGAGLPRLLMWASMTLAIGAGVSGAVATGLEVPAAVYFGAMSAGALTLFELVLRQLRRDDLRTLGAIEAPLPRFRALRWLPGIAFRETLAAWKLAIREGLTRPEDALALARREVRAVPAATATAAAEVDLSSMTKRAAIEHAAAVTGSYEPKTVRAWLAERDIATDPSNAAKILRDLANGRRRELVRAVEG